MKQTTRVFVALVAAVSCCVLPTTAAVPQEGVPTGDLTLVPVANLSSPIAMATRRGTNNLFVAERNGRVRRLRVSGGEVVGDPTLLLDLRRFTDPNGEGGLLGLTFNPRGTKLYVHYTNNQGDTRLVEYKMSDHGTGSRVVRSSRRIVLGLDQPASNHNGGDIVFGPDRLLYMALGDGGPGGDPNNNGQDLGVLLGKVLRINPASSGGRRYQVPATNPFVNQPGRRGAIWLYGVRNPWRISFDRGTGDLYVADVGQMELEEVDFLAANSEGRMAGRGRNLGWRLMEGSQPFDPPTAAAQPHTAGVRVRPRRRGDDNVAAGCAIVGGYVYRGATIPALRGTYLYGDFCSGVIGGITVNGNGTVIGDNPDFGIDVPEFSLQSFGQDNRGELYVMGSDGTVSRIEATL